MAIPDDFCDAGARQRAFNRAFVECEADAHSIAYKADNAARVRGGISSGRAIPVVSKMMKKVHTIPDAMLEFDAEVAEMLLNEFRGRGEEPSENPFCERHEQKLAEHVSGWAKGLPAGIVGFCRVANLSESHLSDLVRPVKEKELHRIRRQYGQRRHQFGLDVEVIRQSGKPPRRKQRTKKKPKFDWKAEAKIAMHWATARDKGTYKADFAKSNDMSLKALNRLLARVRSRP